MTEFTLSIFEANRELGRNYQISGANLPEISTILTCQATASKPSYIPN